MNPLSQALSRNGNNFDLVRLLAAVAVVYGHSYLLQAPDGTHGLGARTRSASTVSARSASTRFFC